MKSIPSTGRLVRLAVCFLLSAGTWPALSAQTASVASDATIASADAAVTLDKLVISASRTPQDPRYTPSAVSLLPLEDVHAAQIESLNRAIEQQPGVIAYNNGAVGSLGTVLMRGASVHQTLLVVDGVRLNDRTSTSQNFLGGADLAGIDRVEVLRGPQSTLYGSSAMGGVIAIETTRGAGAVSGALAATAGSFGTFGASAVVNGAEGPLGFSASAGRYETDNERPQNEYERWTYSARVDYTAAPGVTVGATYRGQESGYNEPGSRLFAFPGTVGFSNDLTTGYAQAQIGETFTSRITLARHRRDYAFTDAFGVSPIANRRDMLDWQNTWEATSRLQVVAGTNYETSRYTVSGARTSDRVAAGYVSAVMRPQENITLTGGARYDDFRSVGSATTGRGGVAWRPQPATKLRATYGTGFSAPGSDDVYGVPSYGQLPNPGLLPESSRGWDVGIDQSFWSDAALASVTYFRNEFRNLFEYETVNFTTFEGRTVNRARATTEGVEVAVAGRLSAWLHGRASYTYLEAHNDNGARLIRRPRHTGDIELQAQPHRAWRVGAGVHIVAARTESIGPVEDYAVTRVFARFAVRPQLLLKVRVENALDESYEELFGYPALSRGVFGSVEWRF